MKSKSSIALNLLLLLVLAACGSNPPPEPARVLGVATDSVAEVAVPAAPVEPVLSLEERWESPFAVSTSGSIRPAPGRDIVVLGADSTIAASLARRTGNEVEMARAPADRPTAEDDRRDPDADRTVTIVLDGDPDRRDSSRRPAARDQRDAERVTTHRVERGETWLGIAGRYGMSYSELQRANPAVEPDRLRVGQVLRVEPTETPRRGPLTHRVEPGQSLFQIARLYDVPIAMLRDVNGLSSDRISPNQVLVIPRSADRD